MISQDALTITIVLLAIVFLLTKILQLIKSFKTGDGCSKCGSNIIWYGHTYRCLNTRCSNSKAPKVQTSKKKRNNTKKYI
jgi:hypothetical protein